MKKILLLAIVFSVFIFDASAQVTFGVKGGMNFSNLRTRTDYWGAGSGDGRIGFYAGGLVDFGLSQRFHIQPEVLFSSEGAKNRDVSLINIPILAKYYVVEGFNIQAGPQFGIVLDDNEGLYSFKSTNFGLKFGAGYELPNGFFFDAGYGLGLTNMLKVSDFYIRHDLNASEYEVVGKIRTRTRNFQVGIGYRF